MKQNQKQILFLTQSLFVLALVLLGTLAANSQPSAQNEKTVQKAAAVYQQKCGFCHAPKSVQAQPDMKSWIRLLYTSACPDVSIKLNEAERRAIKFHLNLEFEKLKTDSKKDPEGSSE